MIDSKKPPQIELAPGLMVPRLLIGLWQVADMERNGQTLDPQRSAEALAKYANAGFNTFDMADHYGSAELIVGQLMTQNTGVRAFTKWCPSPGVMNAATVRAGIDRSLARLSVSRIDLLQLHWWDYGHPAYIDALIELTRLRDQGLIGHLGLTNFDTDHLRLLLRQGLPIATNQVSFSLLDRRAAGRMSQLCRETGVRLLSYGALAGGFLSDRWVGAAEPADIGDWSKSKYQRFIHAIGGWSVLQDILLAARRVADKHRVSVANVAVRWVLEHETVGAVIVGARPGEREHRDDNQAVFSFALDAQDRAWLDAALANSNPLPGDCGDEYRRAPFLTASGDLSHHLESLESAYSVRTTASVRADAPVLNEASVGSSVDSDQRRWVDSGSQWESMAGYSRALRDGDRIVVSGTTATHGTGTVICPGDAEGQTVFILDKIKASIEALGGRLDDVIRTRIYLRDAQQWLGVAQVHGRYFGNIRPVNTMIGGATLIGDYEVEIEAEAVTRSH